MYDYSVRLENSYMTRGLVDPEKTVDVLFCFSGSIEYLYVLATKDSSSKTYQEVLTNGVGLPKSTRSYTYGGLDPSTAYFGWVAAYGSLGGNDRKQDKALRRSLYHRH